MGKEMVVGLLTLALVWCLSCVSGEGETVSSWKIVGLGQRSENISITEFGGVGDGRSVNTKAFREAIYRVEHMPREGGTLFIKATQDSSNWPLIAPLPSYGRGRERPGGRYMSFIHGDGVQDVVITGENGTIDGQGDGWWNKWRQGTLQYTRPNLVEFVNSRDIVFSNVVFKNSPFWNIHPVYSSNVVV